MQQHANHSGLLYACNELAFQLHADAMLSKTTPSHAYYYWQQRITYYYVSRALKDS
jgi:hypothetical protein